MARLENKSPWLSVTVLNQLGCFYPYHFALLFKELQLLLLGHYQEETVEVTMIQDDFFPGLTLVSGTVIFINSN